MRRQQKKADHPSNDEAVFQHSGLECLLNGIDGLAQRHNREPCVQITPNTNARQITSTDVATAVVGISRAHGRHEGLNKPQSHAHSDNIIGQSQWMVAMPGF